MKIFNLPDLGEGLPDAEISEWHVKEGDTVNEDQPLVSMETAKAVVEVPSPQSGKIAKLHGIAGDVIKTGSPLVEFVAQDSSASSDTGTVAGKIEVGNKIVTENLTAVGTGGVKVTPAVRAMAKKLGVDLSAIAATGPNNTITLQDVKNSKATGATGSSTTAKATTSHSQTVVAGIEILKGTRKAMAQAMAKSHTEVAAVNVFDEADISAWIGKEDITSRIIAAVIYAVSKEPALNAWYDSNAVGRKLIKDVDLGLAVDSQEGLFVPVIKACNNKKSNEIRDIIDTYKQQIQQRSVLPQDMLNPSITLSNFGKFAGKQATPMIVPPQVAIIATGRIFKAVVPINDVPTVRTLMPLSLTFDHRAVTGGEATRFLAALMEDLAKSKN